MSADGIATHLPCPAVPEPPGATWSNALRCGNELVISGMTAYLWSVSSDADSANGVVYINDATSYDDFLALKRKSQANAG